MQIFEIAPAGTRALMFLLPLTLLPIVIVTAVLGASLIGMKSARFEVSPAGLRLRGDLYGRTIPAAELLGGAARRVSVDAPSEYQPRRRTIGTGIPGYRAGWFRLRNGEKALLYLTDPTKAVYVPTRAGYAVVVSPVDPDSFIDAIRSVAPGS
jgi:hypothetical protein